MTTTVPVEIRSRGGDVLFAAEVDASIGEPSRRLKAAVEMAVKGGACLDDANLAGAYLARAYLARANLGRANLDGANLAGAYLARAHLASANLGRANLDGANLAGANLDGAYLDGANLARANLGRANLDGANLAGANLASANLAGAHLDDANLAGAYLAGAYLDGARLDGAETLTGSRPILQVGPIGSASRWLVAYVTTAGLRLRAGCFFGTREEFVANLAITHGGNAHAQEYHAALALIDVHAALWAPKECGAAEESAA